MVSGYDVEIVNEAKMDEFIVNFKGPSDSPYCKVRKPRYNNLGTLESKSDLARIIPN